MKKIFKIIAILVAFVLIAGVLFITNAFVGNPISKAIVSDNAKKYVAETYPNTDYYIDRVGYDFKTGGYYAQVKSPSSIDTYFSVHYNMWGKVGYDNYTSYVEDRFNTWQRISSDYRSATDEIINALPYRSDIAFGEIKTLDRGDGDLEFGLDMTSLELDKEYDLYDLGSKYGEITLYVYVEDISVDAAAEVLLEVKKRFENQKQSFYVINLVLRPDDWEPGVGGESTRIENFLYEDIIETGIEDKIDAVLKATQEYYDRMDKQKEQGM